MRRGGLAAFVTLALLWILALSLSPAPISGQTAGLTLTPLAWLPYISAQGTFPPIPSPSHTPTITLTIPVPPPTLNVTPPAPPGGMPGENAMCMAIAGRETCASVSSAKPAAGALVTVYGRHRAGGQAQPGTLMSVSSDPPVSPPACSASANSSGIAACDLGFTGAPTSTVVLVHVSMGGIEALTSFETP